jgi:hypothetical protein
MCRIRDPRPGSRKIHPESGSATLVPVLVSAANFYENSSASTDKNIRPLTAEKFCRTQFLGTWYLVPVLIDKVDMVTKIIFLFLFFLSFFQDHDAQ